MQPREIGLSGEMKADHGNAVSTDNACDRTRTPDPHRLHAREDVHWVDPRTLLDVSLA